VSRVDGDLGRLDLGDDMEGALSDQMRKEMESLLPPVVGCTAKAASQEAIIELTYYNYLQINRYLN
jgi:hypothetical protein